MPAWLIEGNLTVYFLLGAVMVIFFGVWWRTRDRKYLMVAGVAGALLLGYFLLDRAVESDREQIERKLQEMADGVTKHDFDSVFANISDSFSVANVTKAGFRKFADEYARRWQISSLTIWEVTPTEIAREQRRANVEFHFKILTNQTQGFEFFRAKSVFVLDPDGQWRLQSFEVFFGNNQPVPIPGWGG